LAQILSYVPYGMSAATAQRMAALAGAHERDRLQRLVSRTTLVTGGLAVLGAVLMTILAVPLLSLFGNDFAIGSDAVAILCGGLALACLLGPGEDVLNMLGHERAASVSIGIALVVNIGLNFTLIPLAGPIGAAIASASALAVRGLLMAVLAYRRLGLLLPIGSGLFERRARQRHA
jgi:O-antigen/teichoic acid export membrane protein